MDEQWAISSESYIDRLVRMTAYSIGAIMGDGTLRAFPGRDGDSTHVLRLSGMDTEIHERFIKELESAFTVECHTRRSVLSSGKDYYITYVTGSRAPFEFFWTLTNGKSEVPIEIVRAERCTKLDFVAGLMDTDGAVSYSASVHSWNGKRYPKWQLTFDNTNRTLVESLAAILKSLGVQVGKIFSYERGNYRTKYQIHPNMKSFISAGCYFHCERKQKRLNDYLFYVTGSETMYTAPVTPGEDIVQQ